MSTPQSGDSRQSVEASGHHVGMYDSTVRTATGTPVTTWGGKPLVVENGVVTEKR